MDYSLLGYTILNDMNHESRSALPGAPVVLGRPAGRTSARSSALKGWIANSLHQAAWAIEPQPTTLTGSRAGLSRCAGT